jgi:hypothetical protein
MLPEHSRFVYELQVPERSEYGSEDEWGDESASSRKRSRRTRNGARISILSNQWVEIPALDVHKPHEAANGMRPRRRFFDSGIGWQNERNHIINGYKGSISVQEVMEGGGYREDDDDDDDDDDDMEVEDRSAP